MNVWDFGGLILLLGFFGDWEQHTKSIFYYKMLCPLKVPVCLDCL